MGIFLNFFFLPFCFLTFECAFWNTGGEPEGADMEAPGVEELARACGLAPKHMARADLAQMPR